MSLAFFALASWLFWCFWEPSAVAKYIRSATIEPRNPTYKLPKIVINSLNDLSLLPMVDSLTDLLYTEIYPNTSFCSASDAVNMSTVSNGGCISVPYGLQSILSIKIVCANNAYDSAFTVASYLDAACTIGSFITPANGDCTCVSVIDSDNQIVGYVIVNCAGKDQFCTQASEPSITILVAIIVVAIIASFMCIIGTALFCLYGFAMCAGKHDSVSPIPAAVASFNEHPPIATVQTIQVLPPAVIVDNADHDNGVQNMRQPEVVVRQPHRHNHHHPCHREGEDQAERPRSNQERPHHDRRQQSESNLDEPRNDRRRHHRERRLSTKTTPTTTQ